VGRQSAGNIVKEESGVCLWLSLVCREVVEDVLSTAFRDLSQRHKCRE
jgi:hypothetical protein